MYLQTISLRYVSGTYVYPLTVDMVDVENRYPTDSRGELEVPIGSLQTVMVA